MIIVNDNNSSFFIHKNKRKHEQNYSNTVVQYCFIRTKKHNRRNKSTANVVDPFHKSSEKLHCFSTQ